MRLSDVCVLDVVCCGRKTTVLEAARLCANVTLVTSSWSTMRTMRRDDGPRAFSTDRDIVIEVLGKGLDPARTRVEDVMVEHSHLVVARDSEDVNEAAARMHAHGVRRMPIVDQTGALVGIVTLDDLLQIHARDANVLSEIVTKARAHEQRHRR